MMATVQFFPDEWKVTVVATPLSRDARGKLTRGTPVTVALCLPAWQNSTDPQDMGDFSSDTGYLYPPEQAGAFVNGAEVLIPPNDMGPSGLWYVNGDPHVWPLGIEVQLSKTGRV